MLLSSIPKKVKTLKEEEEEQKETHVIQQNNKYMELVMQNVVKMIDHDS